MATDWQSYRKACDRPDVLSRWMLTETAALLEPPLRQRVLEMLAGPLAKPTDHRGGTDTDMFEVTLCPADARSVCRAVEHAVAAGATTPRTSARGLGGFAEAWRELEQASDRSLRAPRPTVAKQPARPPGRANTD